MNGGDEVQCIKESKRVRGLGYRGYIKRSTWNTDEQEKVEG